jgi:hypothetical protein
MKADYAKIRLILLYGGTRRYQHEGIEVWPIQDWIEQDPQNRI